MTLSGVVWNGIAALWMVCQGRSPCPGVFNRIDGIVAVLAQGWNTRANEGCLWSWTTRMELLPVGGSGESRWTSGCLKFVARGLMSPG